MRLLALVSANMSGEWTQIASIDEECRKGGGVGRYARTQNGCLSIFNGGKICKGHPFIGQERKNKPCPNSVSMIMPQKDKSFLYQRPLFLRYEFIL